MTLPIAVDQNDVADIVMYSTMYTQVIMFSTHHAMSRQDNLFASDADEWAVGIKDKSTLIGPNSCNSLLINISLLVNILLKKNISLVMNISLVIIFQW
jgi:hypothetical protein